jgi:hypothetical protein
MTYLKKAAGFPHAFSLESRKDTTVTQFNEQFPTNVRRSFGALGYAFLHAIVQLNTSCLAHE